MCAVGDSIRRNDASSGDSRAMVAGARARPAGARDRGPKWTRPRVEREVSILSPRASAGSGAAREHHRMPVASDAHIATLAATRSFAGDRALLRHVLEEVIVAGDGPRPL